MGLLFTRGVSQGEAEAGPEWPQRADLELKAAQEGLWLTNHVPGNARRLRGDSLKRRGLEANERRNTCCLSGRGPAIVNTVRTVCMTSM